MKQSFLFILFIIGITQVSFAQDENAFKGNPTTFGVKGGLNYTSLLSISDDKNEIGLWGSLFAETRLSKRFGIQYELRYSEYSTAEFIEAPLLLKYYFNEKFNMFFGPRLDFLIDDNDVANSFSVAAEIGVQYNFSNHFFLEGSYSLASENQVRVSAFESGTRSSFRLGIGYKF
ncbi:outer membrane beta-barrel protein [Psychroserpens sp. MEBiC05023]